MIWFSADWHLGHENIIRHSKRPFANAAEMDEAIIANVNKLVKPDDVLYHLGDWSWRDYEGYRRKIACKRIHLILGNHDKDLRRAAERLVKYSLFESIGDFREIKLEDQDITLCHYALRVWNKSHHGSWHLYGHSHGSLPDDPNSLSFDVGVDCHDFKPLSLPQVGEIMSRKTFIPIDHHGAKEHEKVGRY